LFFHDKASGTGAMSLTAGLDEGMVKQFNDYYCSVNPWIDHAMIRPLGSGIFSLLPLGWRVVRKIERIIREEMDAIGGQEMLMPVLTPAELWQRTGRYEIPEVYNLEDRDGRTRVWTQESWEGFLPRLLRGRMHRMLQASLDTGLAHLKAAAERA
jgi:hypothetical protein